MNWKDGIQTRRCKRILVILLGLCLLASDAPAVLSQKNIHEIDSLQQVLSRSADPKQKISILSLLSDLSQESPIRLDFLKQQLNIALRIDSVEAIYASLGGLVEYYYNLSGGRDSMIYWIGKIDSLILIRKEYPDVFYEAKSLLAQSLLWDKNYEMALDEATKLYRLVEKHKSPYGMARCTETLGLIYQRIRHDDEAIDAFDDALKQILSIGKKDYSLIRLASYQAESAVRTTQFEWAEKILQRYRFFIDEQAKLNEQVGDICLVEREYWLLYSFYTSLYLKENKMDKAKEALDMATKYNGNILIEGDYALNTYLAVKARYYEQIGNHTLALHYLDEVLRTERLPEDLRMKADILNHLGRYREALVLCDELYDIALQENNETFFRQINQLRAFHELREKEKKEHELQLSNQRMEHQKKQLVFSVSLSLVLLIVFYVLLRYYKRTRQLKNELLHEKDALLESESNLLKEKKSAENASLMKSAFLANMSHEIRTPLNAIVGFSGLLVEPSVEAEEREEYIHIIKNNTDLLLNLLNDVLDLSRIEAGDMTFNIKKYQLKECCQMALDSVRHRVSGSVKLTFTPSPENIIISTDTLRLQQQLTNLLTNAAKFTQQGEINLSYRLEPEGNKVRIAVTDTGCGIPLEKQKDVFKRFEKLDDYKPGAGLGLSICSIIADRLGGTIFVDSEYVDGARFVLVYPCEVV
ncbi:MAG: Sensor histidine kinase RcsC [Parabacteroides sp.]